MDNVWVKLISSEKYEITLYSILDEEGDLHYRVEVGGNTTDYPTFEQAIKYYSIQHYRLQKPLTKIVKRYTVPLRWVETKGVQVIADNELEAIDRALQMYHPEASYSEIEFDEHCYRTLPYEEIEEVIE